MNEAVQKPVVAVDAMGGDLGAEAIVPGALQALAADASFSVALYGDPAAIGEQLSQCPHDAQQVAIVPCSQDIDMAESPAAAIRGKPDSPIVRAMVDQKAGRVQAVVSAGSTGAMVATSLVVFPNPSTLIPMMVPDLMETRETSKSSSARSRDR